MRQTLALGEEDRANRWPAIRRRLPARGSWIEVAVPLMAAALALAIVWRMTGTRSSVNWPLNDSNMASKVSTPTTFDGRPFLSQINQ